jgi:hypothetical protein
MQMARDRVAIAGRIGSKSGLGGQVRRRARATDTAGRPVRRDPSRVVDSVVRSILGAIRLGCYGGAGALVNERGLALGLLLSVALKDDIWLSFAGLGPGRRVPASGRARVVDSPRVALSVIISLTRSEPPKATRNSCHCRAATWPSKGLSRGTSYASSGARAETNTG